MKKNNFQKILVGLIFAIIFSSCSTLNLVKDLNVDENDFETTNISKIMINVSRENVEVNMWRSNYIKVITYSEDKDFSINSTEKNGTLLITSTKRNSKDSLVVYLPADFYADDITIESTSGKIDCSHLWTENLFVSAVSGNVSLDKIDASYLDASAVSGNLNIKECYVENPVHLSTISGNLVFIGDVPGVRASTTSGDLSFTNFCELENDSSFDAISGNINIALVENSGFCLSYSTVSGRAKNNFTGYNGKNNGADSYKNSGVKLICTTISGNITINKI